MLILLTFEARSTIHLYRPRHRWLDSARDTRFIRLHILRHIRHWSDLPGFAAGSELGCVQSKFLAEIFESYQAAIRFGVLITADHRAQL